MVQGWISLEPYKAGEVILSSPGLGVDGSTGKLPGWFHAG